MADPGRPVIFERYPDTGDVPARSSIDETSMDGTPDDPVKLTTRLLDKYMLDLKDNAHQPSLGQTQIVNRFKIPDSSLQLRHDAKLDKVVTKDEQGKVLDDASLKRLICTYKKAGQRWHRLPLPEPVDVISFMPDTGSFSLGVTGLVMYSFYLCELEFLNQKHLPVLQQTTPLTKYMASMSVEPNVFFMGAGWRGRFVPEVLKVNAVRSLEEARMVFVTTQDRYPSPAVLEARNKALDQRTTYLHQLLKLASQDDTDSAGRIGEIHIANEIGKTHMPETNVNMVSFDPKATFPQHLSRAEPSKLAGNFRLGSICETDGCGQSTPIAILTGKILNDEWAGEHELVLICRRCHRRFMQVHISVNPGKEVDPAAIKITPVYFRMAMSDMFLPVKKGTEQEKWFEQGGKIIARTVPDLPLCRTLKYYSNHWGFTHHKWSLPIDTKRGDAVKAGKNVPRSPPWVDPRLRKPGKLSSFIHRISGEKKAK